jgi:Pyridoxamine 5'-phosphate oxidase
VYWGGFEQAAPSLAARVRAEIERLGFVLVGTLRRDGTPRISPVEAHIVQQHLMLVMIAGSRKARDLERDSRVLLRTPVTNSANPECDVQLRGRVEDVDAVQRNATADSVEATSGWRPRDTWRFFATAISAASCIEWSEGEMRLVRWDEVRGLRPTERRRLDMDGSRYLPIEG